MLVTFARKINFILSLLVLEIFTVDVSSNPPSDIYEYAFDLIGRGIRSFHCKKRKKIYLENIYDRFFDALVLCRFGTDKDICVAITLLILTFAANDVTK